MMDRPPVKEHLRNAALYRPAIESLPGREWKGRLLFQYSMSRQINEALKTSTGMQRWFVCLGVPVACIALAFAVYFGFIQPGNWIECVGSINNWTIPQIGLKEVLIFVAAVNGLTFLIRKRTLIL